jgi:MFS family permease
MTLATLPKHWPIRTGERRAPWTWVGLIALPWASMLYLEQLSIVAMGFKLREFISTPVLITLIGSFNLIFNILVGAGCNYASDRIWTPHGRRKPFLIAGWTIAALGCLALPGVENLWVLVLLVFFYEMLRDVATPYESLCNEVVPPHQRGRANATFTFVRQATIAFFFAVMIGQWDNVYALPWNMVVSGEQLVFWTGSVMTFATVAFVGFGIRESRPAMVSPPMSPRTLAQSAQLLRDFFRDVFGNRQWRALYAVAIAQTIFWIDFGSLAPLLYTEQWTFSKQTYGHLLALSTVATLFVFLPLGGWLADRIDRLRLFQILAMAMTMIHLLFYLFITFAADNAPPSFAAVLTFKLISTGIGTLGTVCSVSLMFDFVPRDRLGTVLSGVGITRGFASILIYNGVGLWITLPGWWSAPAPVGGEIQYDYASGYLYLVLCGVLATLVAFWFGRETRSGRLVPLGVMETQAEAHST